MGIPLVFLLLISSPCFWDWGVVVSPDLDSRVWPLSLDCEVPCAAVYASIRVPGVPSIGESKFGWLTSLLRVPSRLACFTRQAVYWYALHAWDFIFPSVVDFVLLQRRICDTSFWSVLSAGFVGAMSTFWHRLYLDESVLDLWREAMHMSFSTELRSLWRDGIVFVLCVWLLRNHATFQRRWAIFAEALGFAPDWYDVEFCWWAPGSVEISSARQSD